MKLMYKSSIPCAAILFDLDGTLVDSTSSVEQSLFKWATKHGFNAKEIIKIGHGRPTSEFVKMVAPDLDAEVEARAIEENEAQSNEGTVLITGAKELLDTLATDCWAIVTSGGNKLAVTRMKHVGLPFPRVFITADDITNGKPHPEGYLKAANLLGVAPSKCLVLEDSPPGIEAAKTAGMKVIAVATTYKTEELSRADLIIKDLTRIHPTNRGDGLMTISIV